MAQMTVKSVQMYADALIEASSTSTDPALFMALMRSNNIATIRFGDWQKTVDISYQAKAEQTEDGGQEYVCTIRVIVPASLAAQMKGQEIEIMEAR